MTKRVAVLFGTETGNSQDCADRLATAICDIGVPAESIDMGLYDPERLGTESVVFIVTSTFGNGDPPANAEQLLIHVSQESTELSGVHFAVCALGDTTYPLFAQCGKDFDERMELRGATRVGERIDCDGGFDFDTPFEEFRDNCIEWLKAEWDAVSAEGGESATATAEPTEAAVAAGGRPHFEATLAGRQRLTASNSGKDTWHIALSLEEGATYQPGDSYAVSASNDPAEVERVLAWLGASAGDSVELNGSATSLGEALSNGRCLQRISPDLLAALAASSEVAAGLHADRSGLGDFAKRHHVLDLLNTAPPGSIDGSTLVGALKSLAPRLYSIASSQRKHANEVHFTVDAVRYEREGRPMVGVASTWLSERLEVGASLDVTLHANDRFRLPTDGSAVIMIGPGTGIAPFRAFLEELDATGASNRTWLFFGHRSESDDFLYGDEMRAYIESGRLTRLSTAWSRDQAEKVYVQHRMAEAGQDLWSWISQGAHVYVCGDAALMAPDVRTALRSIATEVGGVADGEAWLTELTQAGRYCEDVY